MLSELGDDLAVVRHVDLPAWIVSTFGFCLGLVGVAYLITHPEPLSIWAVEGTLIVVPATTLVYGGHWIATRSLDPLDRWVAAGWTLSGAVITSTFAVGYILSEQLNGSIVTEIEQLALFTALGGAVVALLTVTSVQSQYRRSGAIRMDGGEGTSIFTARNARRVLRALRRGNVGGVVGLLSRLSLGRNYWMKYLIRFKTAEGLIPFDTYGVTLFLDPEDPGISRELLTYGAREEVATAVMRRKTDVLLSLVDGPVTAIDVGANRGYYAFQFADILGERGSIVAVEPEPQNVDSLRRGIAANGFDTITVFEGAIGAEDGTAPMQVSDRSNAHTLDADLPASQQHKYHSTIEVPILSFGSLLDEYDLSPAEVNLVKVDVEGYEVAVVESMTPLFEAGGPDLLFVELHPHRVDSHDLHGIVDTIEHHGFEIIDASSSAVDQLPSYQSVREHLDSDESSHTVELLVQAARTDPGSVRS